jgi:hypothetical protein
MENSKEFVLLQKLNESKLKIFLTLGKGNLNLCIFEVGKKFDILVFGESYEKVKFG